jgi:hypothetical protein
VSPPPSPPLPPPPLPPPPLPLPLPLRVPIAPSLLSAGELLLVLVLAYCLSNCFWRCFCFWRCNFASFLSRRKGCALSSESSKSALSLTDEEKADE